MFTVVFHKVSLGVLLRPTTKAPYGILNSGGLVAETVRAYGWLAVLSARLAFRTRRHL